MNKTNVHCCLHLAVSIKILKIQLNLKIINHNYGRSAVWKTKLYNQDTTSGGKRGYTNSRQKGRRANKNVSRLYIASIKDSNVQLIANAKYATYKPFCK